MTLSGVLRHLPGIEVVEAQDVPRPGSCWQAGCAELSVTLITGTSERATLLRRAEARAATPGRLQQDVPTLAR